MHRFFGIATQSGYSNFSSIAIYVAIAVSILFISRVTPTPSKHPPELQGARSELFKSTKDVDLNVWIFEPDGHDASQTRPAIVFFHGGGFQKGSPAHFRNHARYLASRGMVAMSADYRVYGRNRTTIATAIQDTKSAVRWVRANASRLGVDPNRIAAAGGSAGGLLAASTAFLPEHDDPDGDADIEPIPNALVLFNPVLIMAPIEGRTDIIPFDRPARFIGDASLESLSPYHFIKPANIPTIIFHGVADKTVPYSHAEAFTEAMQAAGNQCELVGYEGKGHGFFNYSRGKGVDYADSVKRMDAFFVSLGWLSES